MMKIIATDPYRIVYSDLIGPPVAATPRGTQVSLTIFRKGPRGVYSLGHRQANKHAMPKQNISHCSEINLAHLFWGLGPSSFFFSTSSSTGTETLTTIVHYTVSSLGGTETNCGSSLL